MRALVAGVVLLGAVRGAAGQAQFTATRDIGFSTWITGSHVNTDYGSTDYGLTFGVNAARHFHRFSLFDAGFEARVGLGTGQTVSERTLFIGPRLERRVGRAHVFADFMAGRGTLGYAGSSTSGLAFSYGGGVDFDLSPHWALKLDYSQESWKLPTETNRLTPAKVSVGVVWRFNLGGSSPR